MQNGTSSEAHKYSGSMIAVSNDLYLSFIKMYIK